MHTGVEMDTEVSVIAKLILVSFLNRQLFGKFSAISKPPF